MLLYSSYPGKKTQCAAGSVDQMIAGFAANDQKSHTDVSRMRKALRNVSENTASNMPVSVVDSMKLYSQTLKKQRKTTEENALVKRKLKYSFKKISSKIISSKTSTMAREAVAQAKREIQKIKAARRTGKYDEEEIEAALDHAKSMERIARKKVKHLEEEEMAKRCSSGSGAESASSVEEDTPADEEDPVKEEIDKLRDEIDVIGERARRGEYIESDNITNEMLDDITEGMEEMLDAIGDLNDLLNELSSSPVNMDPADIDAMRIKHRNREMKEITKADAEYLKAVFDHYEKTAVIDVVL